MKLGKLTDRGCSLTEQRRTNAGKAALRDPECDGTQSLKWQCGVTEQSNKIAENQVQRIQKQRTFQSGGNVPLRSAQYELLSRCMVRAYFPETWLS